MKLSKRALDGLIYAAIVIFALLFLYFGNKVAVRDLTVFDDDGDILTAEAKITEIIGIVENEHEWFSGTEITFSAIVTKGENKNETIIAQQNLGGYAFDDYKIVEKGDKVILMSYSEGDWYFVDYIRVSKILFLGGVFIILLLIFGRIKGVNAILTLGLTCTAIFAVFIPSILSGKNIYSSTIIVCVYSIVVTLFIVYGVNQKSTAAIAGCFGGIITASILTLVMNTGLGLTGYVSEESYHLLYLPVENPIDLRAIIFAGIIIGAVGAVMDVAVSIASALWELKTQAPNLTFSGIFKSGINIGKDIMGSMTNTLVLAYIGSSLSVILLLVVYAGSLAELLNRELIIVEILQALIGSLGILLTMPLTALVCAALYTRKQKAIQEEIEP